MLQDIKRHSIVASQCSWKYAKVVHGAALGPSFATNNWDSARLKLVLIPGNFVGRKEEPKSDRRGIAWLRKVSVYEPCCNLRFGECNVSC